MSGKVETFGKQNSICKRFIPSFRAIAYVIDTQSGTCRRYLQLQGLYVPSVKTTISCYTLLHQAARGKGKNSLRKRRDILVSDRDQQRFFVIIVT